MVTVKQKVLNAFRKYLSIFLYLYTISLISQQNLQGNYNSIDSTGELFTNFIFENNDIFKYESGGDLGVVEYGKGHFVIKNDSLILNYDLTELNESSYHKLKKYFNFKDSIQVKFKIYNFAKEPLNNIQVGNALNCISTTSNKDGEASLKLKREEYNNLIELYVDGEFLDNHIIYLNPDANYEIDVYLSKSAYFRHPKAIKDNLEKYKIIEITNSFLKLQRNNEFMVLKKQKP